MLYISKNRIAERTILFEEEASSSHSDVHSFQTILFFISLPELINKKKTHSSKNLKPNIEYDGGAPKFHPVETSQARFLF